MATHQSGAPLDAPPIDPHPVDPTSGVVDEAKLEPLLVEIRRLARGFVRRAARRALLPPIDVEDMPDDVMLECLSSIREGTWNGHAAPLPAIVSRLVQCRVVDAVRRRENEKIFGPQYAHAVLSMNRSWMAPDVEAEERELEAIRAAALAELPPACREAYQLVRERGLSYTQAARVLGVSRGGVCAFVVKAHQLLRTELRRRGVQTPSRGRRGRQPKKSEERAPQVFTRNPTSADNLVTAEY
jgi:RNA polymerase sigma factor (sigma-70 family)